MPIDIQEKRKAVAATALELSRDLEHILSRLNERPELAVALARKKSVLLTRRLDALEKGLRGDAGRRKRIFYACDRRDLKAYFLIRVKKRKASDREVLGLFNDEALDLSVRENLAKASKYVSGRVSKVGRLLRSLSLVEEDDPDV